MSISTGEVIRLFVFPILGAVLMFVLQPVLFALQIFRLDDVKVNTWVNAHYIPATGIVFACCLLAVLLWVGLNIKFPQASMAAQGKRKAVWWFLLLIPIVGAIFAILLSAASIIAPKGTTGAVLYYVLLYAIDIAVVYWLTTASSTPGTGRSLPPGAGLLNR
jgi:hypothetical protein